MIKNLGKLLPNLLEKIAVLHEKRPDLVIESWPELVGEKIAKMSRALSFQDGVLEVEVTNSTLYSLLVKYEKQRLIQLLQKQFPSVGIRSISFRMG